MSFNLKYIQIYIWLKSSILPEVSYLVFSSLIFLYFFLPLLFTLYFALPYTYYRKWILIIASFIFYAWGEPVWVFLLILSAAVGYFFALQIERNKENPLVSKGILAISISFHLCILGLFKYMGFIIDNINALLSVNIPYHEFPLPIGISFFTFQIISFLVDIYRREINVKPTFMNTILYISFFPQLIAGPIIRYVDIMHEFDNRRFSLPLFSEGINRFIIGLGKKVIFANLAGETVSFFLDGQVEQVSILGAWFGISLFALQIYFDFSGYSDMAIGLGKMFGFHYKENFNYPYVSKSATEFWRRWNISLGLFFRDYVYIPLGGNRRFYVRNLFVVWFLTGLWHGASWNFVLWGIYFGALIYIERKFLFSILNRMPKIISHLYLTKAMLIGWVFFYFTDLNTCMTFLKSLYGLNGNAFVDLYFTVQFNNNLFFYIIAIIASTPLITSIGQKIKSLVVHKHPKIIQDISLPIMNFAILSITTIFLVGNTYNPFLYFRF